MAGLAVALARLGCKVNYVAKEPMSGDRTVQGWVTPELPGVALSLATNHEVVREIVADLSLESVHICQGIRSNGLVAVAQRALAQRGLRQWVLMESVDDSGWRGVVRRLEYRRLFMQRLQQLEGFLAIGYRTPAWVTARGVPPDRVFPFAYFLPDVPSLPNGLQRKPGPYRFVFVGQLISRKRVDWLITALAQLADRSFELWVVGVGPEEQALRSLACRALGDRVRWLGQLPLPEVPSLMAQADCLVLPSVHDGWGAVVSEALMVGTPVICSDACGAAGVVHASGIGGVFPKNELFELRVLLNDQLAYGCVTAQARSHLAAWAACLGAVVGGRYLLEILATKKTGRIAPPAVPWLRDRRW
ncbi:glycosyltransferase family 4 protein [Limnohabitans sp. 2KL-3]|uniref:glycosyltransferase family 4 protein n=1 Tax=Limnohabitans sp. 2KL-3 TaxID=1100700 RepID=UPI000B7FF638|nr:glycosyltransferase family 4 protein [Limnohabitans sp. 2KL-3]